MKLTQRGTLGLAIMAGVALTGAASQATFGSLIASDNASNYSSSWTSGSTGGYGFSSWAFSGPSNNNSNNGGFFIGSSPNIDTSSKSWGMYSNGGYETSAGREFSNGALQAGQTFSISMESYLVQNATGKNSLPASIAIEMTDLTAPNGVFTLYFNGGATDYFVYNSATNSSTDTGLAYSDGGPVSVSFEQTSASAGTLTVGYAGQPSTFKSINLTGLSAAITGFTATANDIGSNNNFYINSASIAAVPEPATLGMLAIGGIGLLTARRRK